MPDVIYNTNVYFNNTYKDKWITTQLSKEIIKAVDNSEVIDEKTILSPVFGNISPKKLSGGVKTLMLIAYDKSKVFNASTCGDNCAEWILKIAENCKIVINLMHLMDFGKGEFKIKVMNTGEHKPLHPDRPSAAKRGYGSKWQRTSKAYLRKHPLCVKCLAQGKFVTATVVDHIIPHRGDHFLMWSDTNWQALCKACHDKKTGNEDSRPKYSY